MSLVPYSGMEYVPPALEGEGNPYTPGKFLQSAFIKVHFLLIPWGKEGRHLSHFSQGETETSQIMPWPNVLWWVPC